MPTKPSLEFKNVLGSIVDLHDGVSEIGCRLRVRGEACRHVIFKDTEFGMTSKLQSIIKECISCCGNYVM